MNRLAEELRRLTLQRRDPRQWARDLKARHERGEHLTAFQVACYRDALRQRSEPDENAYA